MNTVSNIKRKECPWSPGLELISFDVSDSKTVEHLKDVPFLKGTSENDLKEWANCLVA